MIEDQVPQAAMPEGFGADAMPPPPEAPTQEALDANSQFVNLAPESVLASPDRPKAEVSTDGRYNWLNPNAARTAMGQKIFHDIPRKNLFEKVDLQDLGHGGEHQRGTGWAQDRSGTTASGTKVHVRRAEFTSYQVSQDPHYNQQLVRHENGITITVTHGEEGKDQRSLTWYMPADHFLRSNVRGPEDGAKDVPANIVVNEFGKDPLMLTSWDTQRRMPDPRYDAAIQEMGALLSEHLTWQPPAQLGLQAA